MVIITYLPWHDTFLRLLALLAELRRCDDITTTSINNTNDDFRTFLSEAYNRGVPDPGGHLKLFYNGGQNVSSHIHTTMWCTTWMHFKWFNLIELNFVLVCFQYFVFERPLTFQLPSIPENVSHKSSGLE